MFSVSSITRFFLWKNPTCKCIVMFKFFNNNAKVAQNQAVFLSLLGTYNKIFYKSAIKYWRHKLLMNISLSLREKCPYSELFWSLFSRVWTEYGEILRITPNTDTFYAVFVSTVTCNYCLFVY